MNAPLRRKQRAESTPGADAPSSGVGVGGLLLEEEAAAKSISQDDSDLRKGADRCVQGDTS